MAAPDAAGGGALRIRYRVQLVTYSAISAAHNRRHGNVGISQFIESTWYPVVFGFRIPSVGIEPLTLARFAFCWTGTGWEPE